MKIFNTISKTKKFLFGLITIALCFTLVFFAGMRYANDDSIPEITSTLLQDQLKEVSELTTMEYRYTKVGKFENSLTLNGWEIPLTKKSFLLAYSGILKAGVDLTQATVDVHNHTIVVTLEDVEILTHTIDEESIEVYDEDKNIFNPISINDYKAFAIQQKTMVEEEVIEDGILSEAATKTKQVIEKCFNMIPSVKENYQIEITFKKV